METRLFPLWAKSWVLYDNSCFHSSLFSEGSGSCHSDESNLMPSPCCLSPAVFLVLFWGFWVLFWCFLFNLSVFQISVDWNHSVMPETGVDSDSTGRLQATCVEVVSQFCSELRRRQWCVFREDHHASCSHLLSCASLSGLPFLFTAILLIACWSHFVYLSSSCPSALICCDSAFHLRQYQSAILETPLLVATSN